MGTVVKFSSRNGIALEGLTTTDVAGPGLLLNSIVTIRAFPVN